MLPIAPFSRKTATVGFRLPSPNNSAPDPVSCAPAARRRPLRPASMWRPYICDGSGGRQCGGLSPGFLSEKGQAVANLSFPLFRVRLQTRERESTDKAMHPPSPWGRGLGGGERGPRRGTGIGHRCGGRQPLPLPLPQGEGDSVGALFAEESMRPAPPGRSFKIISFFWIYFLDTVDPAPYIGPVNARRAPAATGRDLFAQRLRPSFRPSRRGFETRSSRIAPQPLLRMKLYW